MFINVVRNENGCKYLRLVQSVRTTSKSGKKITTKKIVKHIGPLSKFDDGKPNYLARLRNSFKEGKPLIDSLLPYCSNDEPAREFVIRDGDAACIGHTKLCSNLLLEKILEELGVPSVIAKCKNASKVRFDVYGFVRLLILGRVIEPSSKQATLQQNINYYKPILPEGQFNPDNIYDTLDFLAKNKTKILRRINTSLAQKTNRSTDMIFYDVTNFYYETDQPDEDICLLDAGGNPVLDDNGKEQIIEQGVRKFGVSKEERKLPIVQMGLFMDNNGYPITIETFPGNTLDHLTLRPALQENIENLNLSRFILVADRGICNYPNLCRILKEGNGYIVSKSLLKSCRAERQWIYAEDSYTYKSPKFKYKSRIVERTVKDEDKNIQTIKEKVVVYWSEKFQKRAEAEHRSFITFLEKLLVAPANFRITTLQAKHLRRFFKSQCIDVRSGELIRAADLQAVIDQAAIDEYKKSLGYYQIVTSELEMDNLEVIDKYHGLTQIEDQFREMKGSLSARPLYVRTKEHIDGHLLICLIALIILRVIQKHILASGNISSTPDNYWSTGLNGHRIQTALKDWKVEPLAHDLFRFMDTDKPDLKLILDAFAIGIEPKIYSLSGLKRLKTNIPVFQNNT